MFEDVLLDALSVITTSRNHDFARTTAALSTIEGGLLVLVAGRLSADAAKEIATARRHGRQGIALLLAVSTWASVPNRAGTNGGQGKRGEPLADGEPADPGMQGRNRHEPPVHGEGPELTGGGASAGETALAETILRAAGWQVVTIDAGTPLAVAWQRLPKASGYLAALGRAEPQSAGLAGAAAADQQGLAANGVVPPNRRGAAAR
jgi:hypothetical protein